MMRLGTRPWMAYTWPILRQRVYLHSYTVTTTTTTYLSTEPSNTFRKLIEVVELWP